MGSIQKRGENTYLLTVSNKSGLGGKRLRFTKTVFAKDDKQANKLLIQFENEVKANNFVKPEKLLFENFVQYWLESYAKPNLAPKTYQRYKEMIDLRIIPAFKNLKLDQIKPIHLMQFYENLKEDGIRLDKKPGGLSDRTIQHHHRLMSTMLTQAVQWQFVSDNPAKRVKAPKVRPTESRHYTDEDTLKLIDAINTAPLKYQVMVLLAVYTGIRRGELMGLRWKDIDMDNNSISVKKASQYVRGIGIILKEPKNETSKRTIAIPDFFNGIFKLLKNEQEEDKKKLTSDENTMWNDSGFVFIQDTGAGMHPDTISKWFVKFINEWNETIKNHPEKSSEEKEKLYVPLINFHGLRHTNATLLISQNLDIITISKRLGHSNTSTTLNIYGHQLKNLDRVASSKLENLLKKPVDNSKVSTNCQQDEKNAPE